MHVGCAPFRPFIHSSLRRPGWAASVSKWIVCEMGYGTSLDQTATNWIRGLWGSIGLVVGFGVV